MSTVTVRGPTVGSTGASGAAVTLSQAARASASQEAGQLAEPVPVVAATAVVVQPLRGVQVQVVAGPGDGDVEQPVLLGQPAGVAEGHVAGEGAVH